LVLTNKFVSKNKNEISLFKNSITSKFKVFQGNLRYSRSEFLFE